MANTRFLEAQKARFEKSKEPVIKKRDRAIEKFKKIAKEFTAECRYYEAQLAAIDQAIASLEYTEDAGEISAPSVTPAAAAPPIPAAFSAGPENENIEFDNDTEGVPDNDTESADF